MVDLLKLMGLESKVKNDKTVCVIADAIRSDILHPCDLAEDIAIAHNYNQSILKYILKYLLIVVNTPIPTSTIG